MHEPRTEGRTSLSHFTFKTAFNNPRWLTGAKRWKRNETAMCRFWSSSGTTFWGLYGQKMSVGDGSLNILKLGRKTQFWYKFRRKKRSLATTPLWEEYRVLLRFVRGFFLDYFQSVHLRTKGYLTGDVSLLTSNGATPSRSSFHVEDVEEISQYCRKVDRVKSVSVR